MEAHNHFLGLFNVQRLGVILTPQCQMLYHTSVGRVVVVTDEPKHCRVVYKFDNEVSRESDAAVMCEDCVQ